MEKKGIIEDVFVSWADFRNETSKMVPDLDYHKYIWRGQSRSDWMIESSWKRLKSNGTLDDYLKILDRVYDQISTWSDKEWDIYEKDEKLISKKQQNPYLNEQEYIEKIENKRYNNKELFSFLAFLQHHGFPTPMIDCTKSPYIASYFAFEGSYDNHCNSVAIYRIDKTLLKNISDTEVCKDVKMPVIIEASSKGNVKQIIQQGLYLTLSEKEILKLNEDLKRMVNYSVEPIIKKFTINNSDRKNAMRELEQMGINHLSLFPDIEGMCRMLKEKFFQSADPGLVEEMVNIFSK
jgi:hypothetical protein